VVSIAGEELDVHRTQKAELVPYALWGEIAYQIGGDQLYKEIEAYATSVSAPGNEYFEKVLGGKKVLIMLDELAQYSARLLASNPRFKGQLEAFLMALHGYARSHSVIAVIVTLAGANDAFADQTELLQKLLSDITGEDISVAQAMAIGDRALKGVTSVVARDAMVVVPVQANELSAVLGKRLFSHIDPSVSQEVSEEYFNLYQCILFSNPEKVSSQSFILSYQTVKKNCFPSMFIERKTFWVWISFICKLGITFPSFDITGIE